MSSLGLVYDSQDSAKPMTERSDDQAKIIDESARGGNKSRDDGKVTSRDASQLGETIAKAAPETHAMSAAGSSKKVTQVGEVDEISIASH